MAVSYTHLDVYKRQPTRLSSPSRQGMANCSMTFPSLSSFVFSSIADAAQKRNHPRAKKSMVIPLALWYTMEKPQTPLRRAM